MKLEICVDSYESILNAKNAGADRLELCSALDLYGLTPSVGLVDIAVATAEIEVFAMLRPRPGNFLYTELEFENIKQDIMVLKQRDIDGFVFGALNPDGSLNLPMIQEVVELAFPKKVALHRAFDYSSNGEDDIEKLIEMGMIRILTSGKKEKAVDGLDLLKDLEEKYGNRIEIMAGSGVKADNIHEIYQKTGIKNYHLSARSIAKNNMEFTPDFAYGATHIRVASFDLVKNASEVIEQLGM